MKNVLDGASFRHSRHSALTVGSPPLASASSDRKLINYVRWPRCASSQPLHACKDNLWANNEDGWSLCGGELRRFGQVIKLETSDAHRIVKREPLRLTESAESSRGAPHNRFRGDTHCPRFSTLLLCVRVPPDVGPFRYNLKRFRNSRRMPDA